MYISICICMCVSARVLTASWASPLSRQLHGHQPFTLFCWNRETRWSAGCCSISSPHFTALLAGRSMLFRSISR